MNAGRKWPPQANAQRHIPGQQPIRPRGPNVLQPKAAAPQVRQTPTAPPVYRPQPAPRVLQAKMPATHHPAKQPQRAPAAPPVYRPQPAPKVLQAKTAGVRQQTAYNPPRPAASPACRTDIRRAAQPKAVTGVSRPRVVGRSVQALAPPNPPCVQRMSIRGTAKAAELSSATRNKHVVALGDQPTTAQQAYSSSTFITAEADILTAVDADAHNFTESNGAVSGRFDFDAQVSIYQYQKAEVGAGKAATLDINGVATTCEIGVKKTGDDRIQVTHFMKK